MRSSLRRISDFPGRPIALACSHGGHLELLERLAPAYADLERVWVTAPSAQSAALLARGERVLVVPNPHRSPRRLAVNTRAAARALRAIRPRLVITAGANVAVPFCLMARARGIPVVFLETQARVSRGSLSGRLLAPLADAVLVQWPELLADYPRATVCRPALLDGIAGSPAGPGHGTFVATGSHGQPFDRLLALVDGALERGELPAPALAQGHASAGLALRHLRPVARLEPEAMRNAASRAEVVVTHGGSGVISLALRVGRAPLVLPRRRVHGEHVDDHQVEMTARLEQLGFVVSLDERGVAAARALAAGLSPGAAARALPGPALVDELHGILHP